MPPDPRQYLRDRGLSDESPRDPQPPPFSVNLDTGQIQELPEAVQMNSGGLPDDYAARLVAVDQGIRLMHADGLEEVKTAVRWLHAFLTATEPAPVKQTLHTDE